jgi:hypothetical protein
MGRKKIRMSECAHMCRSLLARTVAEGVTAFSTEATLVSPKHIGIECKFKKNTCCLLDLVNPDLAMCRRRDTFWEFLAVAVIRVLIN